MAPAQHDGNHNVSYICSFNSNGVKSVLIDERNTNFYVDLVNAQ